MILASLILLFSLLALGLLALLDRYDAALLKTQAARRSVEPQKVVYYDAFTDRRQRSGNAVPVGQPERRRVA
jgi:hypothetical protein